MGVPVEIVDVGDQLVVPTGSRLHYLPPTEVPGITAADALDANDQFGTVFSLPVPMAGYIVSALLHDLDDEGSGVELWVFNISPVLAANDAAFSLADFDNLQVVAVLTFATFKDAVNNQVGQTVDTPVPYVSLDGHLYFGLKTLATPTIAASVMPRISMVIAEAV